MRTSRSRLAAARPLLTLASTGLTLALVLHGRSSAACNLYQKTMENLHGQNCDSYPTPYAAETPSGGAGSFFVRDVPRCQTGLDSGCPGEAVRCLDGTRPMVHIDPVAGSDRWIFTLEGGGSCGERAGAVPGDAVTDCMDYYFPRGSDSLEMTTQYPDDATSHVLARKTGTGILRSTDSAFAEYNRVAFNKCSFDRFMGNRDVVGTLTGDPIILHFHGRRIIDAVLKDLNQSRGAITLDGTTLNPLHSASHVVFAGNSGGAGGLIMNMEHLQKKVSAIASDAEVAFVLDARALPGVEAEAKFECSTSCHGSLYGFDGVGTSVLLADNGVDEVTIERSFATYDVGGEMRDLLDTWGDISDPEDYLDASCLEFHPTEPEKCFDEIHVAANHVGENVFWHQTLQDSVHANTPWFWVDNIEPGLVVDPRNGTGEPVYRRERLDRVVYQLDQMLQHRKTMAEDSFSARMGVYIADGDQHVSLFTDEGFFTHSMSKGARSKNFEKALKNFLEASGDTCWVEDAAALYPFTNASCRGWASSW